MSKVCSTLYGVVSSVNNFYVSDVNLAFSPEQVRKIVKENFDSKVAVFKLNKTTETVNYFYQYAPELVRGEIRVFDAKIIMPALKSLWHNFPNEDLKSFFGD